MKNLARQETEGATRKRRRKCLDVEGGRSAPSSRRISQPPLFSRPRLSTLHLIQAKSTDKNAETNYNLQAGLAGHKIKREMWLAFSVPPSNDGNLFLQFL